MVKELCEKVVEVGKVSDGGCVVLVFKEDLLRLICRHALHSGRILEEKQSFDDVTKNEWDVYQVDDSVVGIGDINGYVGRHIN